jgi:hypothetical protein
MWSGLDLCSVIEVVRNLVSKAVNNKQIQLKVALKITNSPFLCEFYDVQQKSGRRSGLKSRLFAVFTRLETGNLIAVCGCVRQLPISRGQSKKKHVKRISPAKSSKISFCFHI